MNTDLGRFGVYLQQSLGCLGQEAPTHFAVTRRLLGDRVLVIRIAGDVPVRVSLAGNAPWVTPLPGVASGADRPAVASGWVEIAAEETDLCAFLRGDFTIEEGLEADRLAVRGALDDVLSFLEALRAWLHGALRAPSFPPLHRRFLAGVPLVPSDDVH